METNDWGERDAETQTSGLQTYTFTVGEEEYTADFRISTDLMDAVDPIIVLDTMGPMEILDALQWNKETQKITVAGETHQTHVVNETGGILEISIPQEAFDDLQPKMAK